MKADSICHSLNPVVHIRLHNVSGQYGDALCGVKRKWTQTGYVKNKKDPGEYWVSLNPKEYEPDYWQPDSRAMSMQVPVCQDCVRLQPGWKQT